MKIIIILLKGALTIGPLLVIYNLIVKYKKNILGKTRRKKLKNKKIEAVKQASKYKIKF